MPSTSKKQHNFMEAIAHSPKFAKKVGVPQSVGKDFAAADKGRKFKEGGLKETDAKSNLGLAKLPTEVRNKMGYMKKGGMAKMRKFAEGGEMDENPYAYAREAAMKSGMGKKTPKLPGEDIERTDENPVTKKIKDVGKYVADMGMSGVVGRAVRGLKKDGMKKGGMAHAEKGEMKKDLSQDKKMIKKAVGMHDKQQHGGKKTNLSTLKKGGMACAPKKMARGGGIEIKGKTKGKMVKMKNGGAC
jgi:hypothetical protein